MSFEDITSGAWEYKSEYQCVRADNVTVAVLPVGSKEEIEANGHLIAAAPELYEALIDMAYIYPYPESCPDHQRALAALAKAGGKVTK